MTAFAPMTAAMTAEERSLALPDFARRTLCDSRLAWLDGDARLVDVYDLWPRLPGRWCDPEGLEPRIGPDGSILRPPQSRGELVLLPLEPWDIGFRARDDARRADALALRYLWECGQPLSITEVALRRLAKMHPITAGRRDAAHRRRWYAAADVLAAHRLAQPLEFAFLRFVVNAYRGNSRPTAIHNLDGENVPPWWHKAQELF